MSSEVNIYTHTLLIQTKHTYIITYTLLYHTYTYTHQVAWILPSNVESSDNHLWIIKNQLQWKSIWFSNYKKILTFLMVFSVKIILGITYYALRFNNRIYKTFIYAFLGDVIIIDNWFIFIGVTHYGLKTSHLQTYPEIIFGEIQCNRFFKDFHTKIWNGLIQTKIWIQLTFSNADYCAWPSENGKMEQMCPMPFRSWKF